MHIPSRLQIGIWVTAATLIVCSLGVRAELKIAKKSIAEHRLQAQHAQPATTSTAATSIAATPEQAANPP